MPRRGCWVISIPHFRHIIRTPENADLAKALDKMKVIAQDVATVMAVPTRSRR